jgi:4-hydroxy-3-polyprenylbenzoate decarboxylase
VLPGILAIQGPAIAPPATSATAPVTPEYHPDLVALCDSLAESMTELDGIAWIVLVDDSEFTAATVANWLWTTFTRSNPATDLLGVRWTQHRKHWGCQGPIVIDARWKPHMAPPLEEDPAVTRRVNELAARGGPLYGLID